MQKTCARTKPSESLQNFRLVQNFLPRSQGMAHGCYTCDSSPESAFLLVSTIAPRMRILADSGHFHGRRISGSFTYAQKFETTVVLNSYKNGPSLRLRTNWKWPESVFLVLTKRKARALLKVTCVNFLSSRISE